MSGIINPNIDPLYFENPLLRLGEGNSYFQPETYREKTARRVDDVRDVIIDDSDEFDDPGILTPEQLRVAMQEDLGVQDGYLVPLNGNSINEVIEDASISHVLSKVVSFAKNFFKMIIGLISSLYRHSTAFLASNIADKALVESCEKKVRKGLALVYELSRVGFW